MKKFVAFAMTLTLIWSLSGCESRQTEVPPSPLPSESVTPPPTPTPIPSPSPTPPTVDTSLTYDPDALEPWQAAYIRLLEDAPEAEKSYYYLYDIDKDGVPELFLICDDYSSGVVYTYQENAVHALNENTELDAFWMLNAALYSWPQGNGILRYQSSAYVCSMGLHSIREGRLDYELLEVDDVKWDGDTVIGSYLAVEDLYPESRMLDSYSALTSTSERKPLFLPILDYTGRDEEKLSGEEAERAEALVAAVLEEDGWFYSVTRYFTGDDPAGWTTWKDYAERNGAELVETRRQDLNGDGAREAVLRLTAGTGEIKSGTGLILSAQDGVVYGYDLGYLEPYTLLSTGAFADRTKDGGYSSFQVRFVKDQRYTIYDTFDLEQEDIFPRSFIFCSGAGGWSTELEVAADGSFTGYFHDSDMGDGGDGYPGGTVYFSNFTGKFGPLTKVNDYTYSMRLERLDVAEAKEEIADEIRWVPSVAYGIEGGDEFMIYLPGAPMEELPEYFVNWVSGPNGLDRDGLLPNYGLFNVETQEGWYGGN